MLVLFLSPSRMRRNAKDHCLHDLCLFSGRITLKYIFPSLIFFAKLSFFSLSRLPICTIGNQKSLLILPCLSSSFVNASHDEL